MTEIDERRFLFAARRAIDRRGLLPEMLEPGLSAHGDGDMVVLTVSDGREVGRFHHGFLGKASSERIRRALVEIAEGLEPRAPNPQAAEVLEAFDRGEAVIDDNPARAFLLARCAHHDGAILISRSDVVEGWPSLLDVPEGW